MQEKMGPALRVRFDSLQAGELLDVDIFLNQKQSAPQSNMNDLIAEEPAAPMERADRLSTIKRSATESQSDLLSFLAGAHEEFALLTDDSPMPAAKVKQTFWINNSIAAEVTPEMLKSILEREDVAHVELSTKIKLEDMLDGTIGPAPPHVFAVSSSSTPSDIGALNSEPSQAAHMGNIDFAVASNGVGPQPSTSVKLINAPLMWKEGLTGEGIIVAIVDSGVNYDHPDLKEQMWDGGAAFPRHGLDFLTGDDDPKDDDPAHGGHGTACAGIVAGNGASGIITGVAPKATIIAVRVGKNLRAISAGLEFAIDHGADVISLSSTEKRGGPQRIVPEPDKFGWRAYCENMLAMGALHANSTGKNGLDEAVLPVPFNIGPPGSCPPPRLHPLQTPRGGVSSAISCGATDDLDNLDGPSGKGPVAWDSLPFVDYPFGPGGAQGLIKPDVCAPGVGTTSCNSEFSVGSAVSPHVTFTGTSAATAYVSGCLALLAQACKRSGKPIVAAHIQEALEKKAVRIIGQTKEKENNFGAGRVDVYAAFQYGKSKGWWS